MADNHRINSIDIARLFAAILVIAIHTQAIEWFPDYSNGNIQILTRIAVPFFFCTSGYFLQKEYARSGCTAIASSLVKIFGLYAALSLVYFAVIFLQNPSLLYEAKKWMLIDFLFNGSYYHLWYLVGVIYSVAVICMICKLGLLKMLFPLSMICYVVGLLGTSYYGIGSRLPGLCILFDSNWFLSVCWIFLMGLPFTVLGWVISEDRPKFSLTRKRLLFTTGLIAALFVAEIITVTVLGVSKTIVITVFLYPLLFLLFNLCLAYPCEKQKRLAAACKDTANVTYFWHPLVILMLNRIVTDRFLLFLVATVICLMIGLGYHALKNQRRYSHEHLSNF